MYMRLIHLASMANTFNVEVCKTYSIRSARKMSLFSDFVLAAFLSVVCSLLTITPVTYAGGKYALAFDGVDDYLDAENIYEKLSQLTVEFWMWRPESTNEGGYLLGNSFRNSNVQPVIASKEGFRFLKRLSPVGNLQFRVYEAEHDAGRTMSIDTAPNEEWVHTVGVFNAAGNEMKIYVNGVEQASADVGGAAHTGIGNRLRVGQNPAGETCLPETKIDEVRIWNYARTQEQIQEYMNLGLSGGEEGLLGYWKFDEGAGVTAHDSSPNQNHGTISGAIWATDAAPVSGFRFTAHHPAPATEATDVPRDVILSWTPGVFAPPANGHIVYFSNSFSDVNDGVGGVTQSATSYDPGRLEFSTTYYWRVDEVNAPPDSTVFRGDIWSFTTEPMSYPIDGANITATASSVGQADFGPEKTIDGSGLDADDQHSTVATDMWLSGNELTGAWIQYEFDKPCKLHQMCVWNANQTFEGLFGFGMKDVTVEYSTNGADWTALADVPDFAQAPGTAGYIYNTTVDFGGVAATFVKLTAASNWGGILPQYGLSEVRFFSIPVVARDPSPEVGVSDVAPAITLTWRAGREAALHDVYLSTDEQAVVDGTAPATSVADTSYSAALELGNTYYWRVDEVNEAETPVIWQGDVWDFTTQQFIVVEDFEDYNDYPPYEIYSTWLDGYENPSNGSQVGYLAPPAVETTIVHGGSGQSMPLLYSNTSGAVYSEATRTFAVPQDWTKYGIQTLVLHFYGAEGNTGQLYVKINGVKVPYSGDAAAVEQLQWNQWNIDLATLGVNLQSITTLAIGIDGDGAAGTVYVDDIVLYRSAPPASAEEISIH